MEYPFDLPSLNVSAHSRLPVTQIALRSPRHRKEVATDFHTHHSPLHPSSGQGKLDKYQIKYFSRINFISLSDTLFAIWEHSGRMIRLPTRGGRLPTVTGNPHSGENNLQGLWGSVGRLCVSGVFVRSTDLWVNSHCALRNRLRKSSGHCPKPMTG